MLKFKLRSGKVIEFNLANVETALALYRVIVSECKKAKLDITVANEETWLTMINKNMEAILNIVGSEEVMEAIKECCSRVLYDKQRFSMELFEDVKARGDFFGVMLVVAVENLRPFFPENSSTFDTITSLVLMS